MRQRIELREAFHESTRLLDAILPSHYDLHHVRLGDGSLGRHSESGRLGV